MRVYSYSYHRYPQLYIHKMCTRNAGAWVQVMLSPLIYWAFCLFFRFWPLLHHAFDNCFFDNLYLRAWGTRLVLTPYQSCILPSDIFLYGYDHMIIVHEKVQQIKLARTLSIIIDLNKKISKKNFSWCSDESMNALADKVRKQGVPHVICTCTP